DDARRAGPFGAPADRAEIVRVGDLVEAGEQRPLALGQRIRVRVPIRVAKRDNSLVVPRGRGLGEPALPDDLEPETPLLAQPRFGGERAFADEQLEHLPASRAEDLSYRPPPVHEL